jgi:hypothetical protein
MHWKILVGVLATAVLAESAFIIFGRHPINRFRAVDVDGYLAFDTATGQLCKTIRTKPISKGNQSSPAADRSPQPRLASPDGDKTSKGWDAIVDAIQNSPSNSETEEKYRLELIRELPACADIR